MRSRSFPKNQQAANGGNAATAKGNGTEESREGKRSGYTLLKRLTPPLVLGVGYALLAALLLPHQPGMPAYEIGLPSPAKLIASRNFKIADNDHTLALRQEALEKVIPVFREDPEAIRNARDKIDRWFKAAQAVTQNPEIPAEQRRQRLAETIQLSPEEQGATVDLLLSYSNYGLLQETLKSILTETLQNGVVPSQEDWAGIQRRLKDGIDVADAQGNVARRMEVESILDTEQARQKLRNLVAARFNKQQEDKQPRQLADALVDLVLSPNLVPHETLQQERERLARQSVPEVIVEIQKGQMLVDEGEIISEKLQVRSHSGELVTVNADLLLNEILPKNDSLAWFQGTARGLLIFVPLLLWGIYVRRYHHALWRDLTKLACLVGLVVIVVAIGQLLAYLSVALEGNLQHIGYAMPVALAGLLVTILLESQLAFFTVLVLALYSAVLFGQIDFLIVNLIAGLVAIFSTSTVRRRIDITWAGSKVALAACAMATLLYLVQFDSWGALRADMHPWALILIWSILHGILTVMLAGLLLPLLESLMGVITDFQLLELSQKTELLKQLEAEAPGTYHHSLNVATLAESAAEAIGARGLLARVAALYHDIGKLNKPVYFSENQTQATEKKTHSKLTPSMSRLLICNHIKDGQEMADAHNLPKFIRDAISQHHGTTLLTYFYDKALQEDSKDVVNESDYRYPGPRPQTVEMAILMLADSLEGASRSLPMGLTQGELYQFVRKIINQKFMDNQLDECDLTLSDLHRLAEAFSRSLASLLHRRVAYPTVPLDAEKQEKQAFPRSKPPGQEAEETATPVGAGSPGNPVQSNRGAS